MNESLNWKKIASRDGPSIPLFKIRLDTLLHPQTSEPFERVVLQAPDWINVVAVTAAQELIMVEQYRFGVSELTIEPVGGLVDPGEDSLTAAKRELLEETGYGHGQWRYLGAVHANPAIHDNLCHHWLAEGVEFIQEATPDSGESIGVHRMTLGQIKECIADGRLRHALGLSALSRVFPIFDLPHVMASPESGDVI